MQPFIFLNINNINNTNIFNVLLSKYKEIINMHLNAEKYQDKLILVKLIRTPFRNHYNTIIFNSLESTTNSSFSSDNIYYHDGMKNGGNIVTLKQGDDWKKIGIPYIV